MSIRKVQEVDDLVPIKTAIMSVSDKTGLDIFVPALIELNPDITIYSTGGTYKKLREIMGEDNTNVQDVATYIGQPETEGGLVKTLDFKLYLGYLTETYCPGHQQDLKRTNSVPIDLVVFNLYPFEQTVAKEGIDIEDARGNIDIGGPSALRAAAKNWHRVTTIVNEKDYYFVAKEMQVNNGCTRLESRFDLHKKVFRHLADYNTSIANYVEGVNSKDAIKPYVIHNTKEYP
jgi:phosphoribosylaminoimidazolecarboxamide formyltransferase/IMP cyclohydrolase